jgi:hypothetical protein
MQMAPFFAFWAAGPSIKPKLDMLTVLIRIDISY